MKLPIGLDSFEKIRTNDFYYVDKTLFIKELLENWGEVNQFTRPRRFGKSLNMSMLQSFFEVGGDPALFDGLKISREKELCANYQGKFPVISISLKSVDGRSFSSASAALRTVIGNEAMRFQFLKESEKLSEEEKEAYKRLIQIGSGEGGLYAMTEEVAAASLKVLSQLLAKHCGQKAILLVDEYCIFRPSESKETVGVSPPSREKQVQVHGRESTGVLFWKEMAKERFAKRSSACHLFRLESFSFAHGVISIDEDLVGTVLNPVQHSIC